MRIVHISSSESAGGASRAANRLHRGLLALGCDSWMYVNSRQSGDPRVALFQPPMQPAARLRRLVRRLPLGSHDGVYLNIAPNPGSQYFTNDRTRHGPDVTQQAPDADIYNLHWVSGFVDCPDFLEHAARRAPVVWTLHDMNAFTGGCHCDGGCGRYAAQCGCCPQLNSKREDDLSRRIWKRRQKAYAAVHGRLHVVTPSRWMASEAKRSALLKDFPVSVIPNGLDVQDFAPRDRNLAREVFGIPKDKLVVFCSANSLQDSWKGMSLLAQALQRLKDRRDWLLVTLGHGNVFEKLGLPHLWLGRLENDRLISLAYSAADVFVCPSLQDNLPNTVMEALASGVPVAGFDTGGIPDMVRDGVSGKLAPVGDSAALAEAIRELFDNRVLRAEMAVHCRRIAVQEYSLEMQAKRYMELYASISEPHKQRDTAPARNEAETGAIAQQA